MNNPIVIAWLLEAATLIGFVLLTGCLAYGLALLLFPRAALQLSERLNRRYSSRRALRAIEIPRAAEPFFYRHHRVAGGLLLTGVIAFFVVYFVDFPRDSVLARLGQAVGRPLAGVLLDSLVTTFIVLNVLIGVLAMMMMLRPSLLKPVESVANRWISTRRAFRGIDENHTPLDRIVQGFPRITGLLILFGVMCVAFGIIIASM